ncbi:wtf meiotic driver [Schizosaccharomyces osmophilus]|uniref:Wtf meiotic driver n=1 Tax=Schizosaccharomyces osmophilus TaxID=2545709 RepID=A0AAF0AY99_9SCHI|nr:wtf meiotic driver [Schizosaccharomyces osmophilus]WBW74449.1 wtf meiotic driver [Schizosaccharomyces osmophilus]
MKNNYAPVSSSEASFKTLNDEKSGIQSSDGTPPPYSDSYKFSDLEMADGSAHSSAEESANKYKRALENFVVLLFILIFGYYSFLVGFYVIFFVYKFPVKAQVHWGLLGGWVTSMMLFLAGSIAINPIMPEVLIGNMLVAAFHTVVFDAFCLASSFGLKKYGMFENLNPAVYWLIFITINTFLFLVLTTNQKARECMNSNLVNGISGLANGISGLAKGMSGLAKGMSGLASALSCTFEKFNAQDERHSNEEIELQPLDDQRTEF